MTTRSAPAVVSQFRLQSVHHAGLPLPGSKERAGGADALASAMNDDLRRMVELACGAPSTAMVDDVLRAALPRLEYGGFKAVDEWLAKGRGSAAAAARNPLEGARLISQGPVRRAHFRMPHLLGTPPAALSLALYTCEASSPPFSFFLPPFRLAQASR